MSKLPIVTLEFLNKEDPSLPEAGVGLQPSSDIQLDFACPGAPKLHNTSCPNHPPINPLFTPEETGSTSTDSRCRTATPLNVQHSEIAMAAPPTPQLSRAYSMPLPSQTAHLQHPTRIPGSESLRASVSMGDLASGTQQFQELSVELADSLQMAIQTLLRLSPPHLFDAGKEQFSSCSIQVPTTSMSALLTSMKNLNYISAYMHKLATPVHNSGSSLTERGNVSPGNDFDIGELLQSVGDSLAGAAAQAEVDLVLHHGDAGIKHIGVKGDECGISYALTHIIHQVLTTTKNGDSIEIGLSIAGPPSPVIRDNVASNSSSRRASMSSSSFESPVLDDEGLVTCTFDIAHKFFSSSVDARSPNGPNGELPPEQMDEEQPSETEIRPEPQFNTILLRRLLENICGTLRPSLQPRLFRTGRRCELSVTLDRFPLNLCNQSMEGEMGHQSSKGYPAQEPTLEELTSFSETLRGKKVAFYASSRGSFAHHLTRYLTAWGMDISHVPTDDNDIKDSAEEEAVIRVESAFTSSTVSSPGLGLGVSMNEVVPPIADSASDTAEDTPPAPEHRLSFVIIDDDIVALRRRLMQHRSDSSPNLHLQPRKQRFPLTANPRPRPSPSIRNPFLAAGAGAHHQSSVPTAFTSVPILHFTSLANYKIVKDAIQTALVVSPGSSNLLPEVIVILKPAGPRRLLTALHTAVHRPVIDPFFLPIATVPIIPSGSVLPFTTGHKSMNSTTPPLGVGRSDLVRSTRSPRESGPDSTVGATLPQSSPLAMSDGFEYFSDAAVRKLGGNAASGLVIQSPDGRPAGIFFQPQSRTSSLKTNPSAAVVEREQGILGSPRSHNTSRQSGVQRVRSTSIADMSVGSDSAFSTPPIRQPSFPYTDALLSPSPSGGRAKTMEPTQFPRLYSKGKGSVVASSIEQEKLRISPSSATWGETTQTLSRQIPTPSTVSDANTDSVAISGVPESPTADAKPSSMRKTSQAFALPPVSHSPSSPSPDNRLPAARRVFQGTKSPITPPGVKKHKTVGNNIVPPISVLIVEDNAINQTILSTFMRRNKIKYEVAWNGREAVEKWRNGNFHLILMDIQMPVMDGIEATKEIRRLEKLEHAVSFPSSPGEGSQRPTESPDSRPPSASSTPFRSQVIIVALTASSLQSDRVAALAAGCNDFLTKPVTNSWLNDKVIEWGSIKALQMWAELRPEVSKNIRQGQEAQARAIADKLHVPPASERKSPSDGNVPQSIVERTSRERIDHAPVAGKALRHSYDESSGSDSSRDKCTIFPGEGCAMQDPMTEPPAVIETPERITVPLPITDPEPHLRSEEASLLGHPDGSRKQDISGRTFLAQRAGGSLTSPTSIVSAVHGTPAAREKSLQGISITPPDVPHEPPDGNNWHTKDH